MPWRGWVVALLGLISAAPSLAQSVDPDVDEIVRRYLVAHGGIERWREVRTLRLSGRMELGSEVEVPFVQELKRPDKARFEFEFRGETAVQAFDGRGGWKYRPYAGYDSPESMRAEELESARREADFDGPLFDLAAKGNQVELVGVTQVDGHEAYELKLTLATGAVQHVFLDTGSFNELKVIREREVRGTPTQVVTYKSDHRWIGGLLLPFRYETQVAGSSERRRVTIERVELDVPIEDARFQPPVS